MVICDHPGILSDDDSELVDEYVYAIWEDENAKTKEGAQEKAEVFSPRAQFL